MQQRDEGQRPVHLTVDVGQGVVMEMSATDAEWDEIDARTAAAAAAQTARQAEDEQLRAAAAAHPDPIVQVLAKRVGIL